VDTLYRREYIRGQSISITGIGENIIETLEQYCPEIIQVGLTRELEEELRLIEEGEKVPDSVFDDVVSDLKPILSKFKENEAQIGASISGKMNKEGDVHNLCKVCSRSKSDGSVFCRHHDVAYMNLEDGFKQWRYALGYQWKEYLEKVSKVSGTGSYVKEIINSILD
jgi:hypothetical protein